MAAPPERCEPEPLHLVEEPPQARVVIRRLLRRQAYRAALLRDENSRAGYADRSERHPHYSRNAGPGVHYNSTRLGGTLCPEASTGPQRRECTVRIKTHCGDSVIPSASCKSPAVANLHRPRQLEALLVLRTLGFADNFIKLRVARHRPKERHRDRERSRRNTCEAAQFDSGNGRRCGKAAFYQAFFCRKRRYLGWGGSLRTRSSSSRIS